MRKWTQLVLVLVVTPLVGGWDWFGKYGSKHEAVEACKAWVKAGPTKTVQVSQYRTRQKNKNYYFPDGLREKYSIPGEWSMWWDVETAPFVPEETPGMEVEKRQFSVTQKIRGCIPESETKQLLGMENRQIKKRFKY